MRKIISKEKEIKPKLSPRQRFIIIGLILNLSVYVLLWLSKQPGWLKWAFDGSLIILSIDKIKEIWFEGKNTNAGIISRE